MPRFLNVPKILLSLVALGALLLAAGMGFLIYGHARTDDPDFHFSWLYVFFWVIAPLAIALYAAVLLGWYWGPLKRAAGDSRVALASIVWLADFALAAILTLYFWDDATISPAQYHGLLIDGGMLQVFGLIAFFTSGACLSAIAERFPARPALYLLGILAAATYLSEASSTWLGFTPAGDTPIHLAFVASMAVVAVGVRVLLALRRP